MTTPTREEIDAKLEAIEASMDARVRSIEGKVDAHIAEMRGQYRVISLLSDRAVAASEAAARAAERASLAAKRAAGVKQTLVITSLATFLSVVAIAVAGYFGIQHSNAVLLQSALQSFEAGRLSVEKPAGTASGLAPKPSSTPD